MPSDFAVLSRNAVPAMLFVDLLAGCTCKRARLVRPSCAQTVLVFHGFYTTLHADIPEAVPFSTLSSQKAASLQIFKHSLAQFNLPCISQHLTAVSWWNALT